MRRNSPIFATRVPIPCISPSEISPKKSVENLPRAHMSYYLPPSKLQHVTNKAQHGRLLGNLYHACMGKILKPLEAAGRDGIFMTSGDGKKRRNHLIFTSFIGDYPEQILTTEVCSSLMAFISWSPQPWKSLSRLSIPLTRILPPFFRHAPRLESSPLLIPFGRTCHIYRSITPDILHQLYQAVLKHLIRWLIEACGAEEIGTRCRRMAPNHNIRLFLKGITSLSRVTGQEHDQMCQILLGLVIDVPVGSNGRRLVCAVRALLNFLYLAQYPIHTDTTLELVDDALKCFHANKDIFVDLELRDGFNILKLHFASHYSTLINRARCFHQPTTKSIWGKLFLWCSPSLCRSENLPKYCSCADGATIARDLAAVQDSSCLAQDKVSTYTHISATADAVHVHPARKDARGQVMMPYPVGNSSPLIISFHSWGSYVF